MTDVIDATDASWMEAYRKANLLARAGGRPRWAAEAAGGARPGDIVLPSGGEVPKGSLEIRPIRIGLYGNGGAPYNHAAAFAEAGFLTEFVFASDILAGALAEFDLLVMPGGGCRAMMGQLDPLGEAGCRAIADWVRGGSMYLGCCAGAFDASLVSDSFLAVCPHQRELRLIDARVWNDGDAFLGLQSPGVGVIRSRVAAADHPVCRGMPAEFEISHYNGPFYALRPGSVAGASEVEGLLAVAGSREAFTPAERFLGAEVADSALLVREAAAAGAFNAVAGRFGKGRVVLFGSHPEFGLSLDLDAYGAPARLLANAALWQATAPGPRREARRPAGGIATSGEIAGGLDTVMTRLPGIVAAAEALLRLETDDASWLTDALAMSTFGERGEAIWRRNLAGFAPTAKRIAETAADLKSLAVQIEGRPGAEPALAALAAAIHLRVPSEWENDVGYEGVLQQFDRVERMLARAEAEFGRDFAPDDNAYAYLEDSPFHLAVGSYLSAAGVFANAGLLLRTHRWQLEAVQKEPTFA